MANIAPLINFSTPTEFNNGNTEYIEIAFDPNNAKKFVAVYRDTSNSNYGTAIVGTVSGNSISYGPEVVFYSGTTAWTSIAFDPNTSGKFVVSYMDGTSGGSACVGTVSGTNITFGTAVVFETSEANYSTIAFDPNTANKFVIAYKDVGNLNYGTAIEGTLSGTSVSFGTEAVFNSVLSDLISVAYDPNTAGKFISVCKGTAAGDGIAVVSQLAATVSTENLTATNFLGTSQAAYTDTQTASIMLQGSISTNQTGLTIGSTYYVQPDGTLTTSAGTPSVIAGKAISATSLLLKGI